MRTTTLHLAHDDEAGVCLWAHVTTEDRRARPLASLEEVLEADPTLLAGLGLWIRRPLRQRILTARAGRVPAMPLPGARLAQVTGALRERIRALGENSETHPVRTDDDCDALIASLAAASTPVALGPGVGAGTDLLSVLNVDSHARTLVAERQVVPTLASTPLAVVARWQVAPGALGPANRRGRSHPVLDALTDSHARLAMAYATRAALPHAETLASLDPLGSALLDALGPDSSKVPLTPPRRRLLQALLDRFVDTGLSGVLLADREPELVVRVHAHERVLPWQGEPTSGPPSLATALPHGGDESEDLGRASLWAIDVCLREHSGVVHPLGDLVAVGDLSTVGALEHAARVRRSAPILAGLEAEPGGMTWTLSTTQVSRFLGTDVAELEGAGITVLMPREWTKQRLTVRADVDATDEEPTVRHRDRTGGGGISQTMASFRFGFAVGDEELSEEEIQEILREQSELVRLRGTWVRVDPSTLRAAEKFLAAFRDLSHIRDPLRREWAVRQRMQGPRTEAPKDRWDRLLDVINEKEGPGEGDGALRPREAAPDPLVPDGERVLDAEQWRRIMGSEAARGLDLEVYAASNENATGIEALFGAEVRMPDLPAPRGLTATLRPYQKRGLDWLTFLDTHGYGGILADDMGLGKTMQVLALLVREREDPQGLGWGTRIGGPTLLVCPMSVLGSWQREAAMFAPELRVHVHHGPGRLSGDALREAVHGADLVLTTYALITRDFDDLSTLLFHRLILDEAQHVKNASTGVTKAVRALPEGRRLALTGTPVENDLTDLHSIMSITNPGLLPASEKAFKEAFAEPIADGEQAAREQLVRLTQPYILRRVKTDRRIISDLPDKREERTFVNITSEQAGLYQALADEMSRELGELGGPDTAALDLRRRAIVSGTLMKMKQVLGHPAHYLGDGSTILRDGEHRSGKLERLDDLLATIVASNEKALIFTQFTAFSAPMIEHWERTFGISVPFLHGGISKAERDHMVSQFQSSPGEPGAMLLSLRAGGTGITLTAANHVIHLDRWWNPAVENQATDRAFRIGQQRNVSVHKLIALGTIEEAIDEKLSAKSALAESTIASGESWLTDLSDATLRSMFSLKSPRTEG